MGKKSLIIFNAIQHVIAGNSVFKTAKMFNISCITLSKRLKEYLNSNPSVNYIPRSHTFRDIYDIKDAIEELLNGEKYRYVSEKYGIPIGSLGKYKKDYLEHGNNRDYLIRNGGTSTSNIFKIIKYIIDNPHVSISDAVDTVTTISKFKRLRVITTISNILSYRPLDLVKELFSIQGNLMRLTSTNSNVLHALNFNVFANAFMDFHRPLYLSDFLRADIPTPKVKTLQTCIFTHAVKNIAGFKNKLIDCSKEYITEYRDNFDSYVDKALKDLSKKDKYALITYFTNPGGKGNLPIPDYDKKYDKVALCGCFGITYKTYYNWCKNGVAGTIAEEQRERLDSIVKFINEKLPTAGCRMIAAYICEYFTEGKDPYELAKIKRFEIDPNCDKFQSIVESQLKNTDYCCHNTVNASMRRQNIKSVSNNRRRKTGLSPSPEHNKYPNILNRDFSADYKGQKLCTDVTMVKLSNGKRVYITAILDLFDNKIVGVYANTVASFEDLIKPMLNQAKGLFSRGTLVHSDQGSQYTSFAYESYLRKFGVTQSMSRRGNCLDNSKIENWFGTLKRESRVRYCSTLEQLQEELYSYVAFFNSDRLRYKKKLAHKDGASLQS